MNHSCNGDFFKVTDVSLYRCLFDGQIVRLSEDARTCPSCKRLIKVARSHGERPVFVTELRQVSLTIASSNVITDEMFSTGDFSVTLPEDVITDFRRGPHSSLPPSVAEFLTTYDNYLQDCYCGRRTENSVVGGDPQSDHLRPAAVIGRMVQEFLEEPRESSGGWAEITDKDFEDLHLILRVLIELKCSPDPDGDLPIEFKLVNRRTHEPIHFMPVPYESKCNSWSDLHRIIEINHLNLSIANDKLDTIMRIWRHRLEQQRQMELEETVEEALIRLEKPVTEEDITHENLPLLTDEEMRVVRNIDIEKILRKANRKHERSKREEAGGA